MENRDELVEKLQKIQAEERAIRDQIQELDREKTELRLSSFVGKYFKKHRGVYMRCEEVKNFRVLGTEIFVIDERVVTVYFKHNLHVDYFEEEETMEIEREEFDKFLLQAKDLIKL